LSVGSTPSLLASDIFEEREWTHGYWLQNKSPLSPFGLAVAQGSLPFSYVFSSFFDSPTHDALSVWMQKDIKFAEPM
jgi:hypothetical protein